MKPARKKVNWGGGGGGDLYVADSVTVALIFKNESFIVSSIMIQ